MSKSPRPRLTARSPSRHPNSTSPPIASMRSTSCGQLALWSVEMRTACPACVESTARQSPAFAHQPLPRSVKKHRAQAPSRYFSRFALRWHRRKAS
eukprot:6417268-Prymnesium_polylepis.1